MTDIDMEKLCKGCLCLVYGGNLNHGRCLGYRVKDVTCPCINCLVKMMCKDSCDKYQNRRWYELMREMS